VKKIIKKISCLLGITISRSVSSGFHMFTYVIKSGCTPSQTSELMRSFCLKVIKDDRSSILEIGTGDGRLPEWLSEDGVKFTYQGIDYGKSNDFANNKLKFQIENTLFLEYKTDKLYDVVCSSHFIEHQSDIGATLKKMFSLVKVGGYVIFEWPLPHRLLFGGHVSFLTAAQLVYNIAKTGVNVKYSTGLNFGEYAVLVVKHVGYISTTELKWDTGEIDQLKGALPDKIYEDCDSYIEWDILKLK
jgi:SAM-dependent methyltransferase